MKVDYEYLKQLLEAFEEVPKPFPLISEISQISSSVNNQFAFHMGILHDQGFIQYLLVMVDHLLPLISMILMTFLGVTVMCV
ncbi:hypothetical protein D0856_04915 [Vibrio owensii]|uniref:hypothetical protein n=1 Tax=Vibrio owensii TaxID=696485 RepID=UPI000EFC3369|nr:hypothetical protein [Vibrio owensii]AYO19536.1 hypothetical protein D0856_04915 [Vibrio owensii]